jgi:glutaredoxin
MEYTVFGKPNCQYCVKAKALLEKKGEAYRYADVESDSMALQSMHDMVLDATGAKARTVPQIFVDSDHYLTYIGGYDQLEIHLKDKESLDDLEFEFDEL